MFWLCSLHSHMLCTAVLCTATAAQCPSVCCLCEQTSESLLVFAPAQAASHGSVHGDAAAADGNRARGGLRLGGLGIRFPRALRALDLRLCLLGLPVRALPRGENTNTRPKPPELNQLSPGSSRVCKPESRRGGGGRRCGTSGTHRRCRGGMQRSMRRSRPIRMRRFTPSPSAAAVRCHVWVVIARGPVLS